MGFLKKIFGGNESPSVEHSNATQKLKALAKRGDAKAQFELALVYAKGKELPQDYKEAIKWIELSAEGGYDVAQNELGAAYATGSAGVSQNYKEAFKWYKLAARQNFMKAQHSIGFMYKEGQGVPQDYVETIKWYKLAANQGHSASQYGLGNMYRYGQGIKSDDEEATKWYRRAADQGNEHAKLALSNDIKLDLEYRYGHFWYAWAEIESGSHFINMKWVDGPSKGEIQRELATRNIAANLNRIQSLKSKKTYGVTQSGFQKWSSVSLPLINDRELLETLEFNKRED